MNLLSLFAPAAVLVTASFFPMPFGGVQDPAPDVGDAGDTGAAVAEAVVAPGILWTTEDLKALGFALAKQGKFQEAVGVADELLASEGVGDARGRIERFRSRAAELQILRMDYLSSLVAEGSKLKFTYQDKSASVVVIGVTETEIEFAKDKRVPTKLPITAVSMKDLVKLTRRLEPKLGSPGSRGLLAVLGEDKVWEKRLDRDLGDGGDPTGIQVDLTEVAPLLDHGNAIQFIRAFAESSATTYAEKIADLDTMVAACGQHAAFAAHRVSIRAMVEGLFLDNFTDADIPAAVMATEVTVTDGVIHLIYEFEEKHELLDFELIEETPALTIMAWWNMTRPEDEWEYNINGRVLSVVGAYNFKHFLNLSAPVSTEMTTFLNFSPQDVTKGNLAETATTVCDNLGDRYVLGTRHGAMLGCSGEDGAKVIQDENRLSHKFNKMYKSGLTYADGVLKASDNDRETLSTTGASATSGYAQLVVRSDFYMDVCSYELKGTLNETSRKELAQMFVKRQLESRGL